MKREVGNNVVIVSMLIVAIAFIFMNSNFNLTGNAIIDGCDGNWTSEAGECVDGTQIITWTSEDTTTCNNSVTESQDCEIETCEEDWVCGNWVECNNRSQTRECLERNNCGTENNKPSEVQECAICGDEIWDDALGEECELGTENSLCITENGYAGMQNCSSGCTWDICVPSESCGDSNINVNASEECDEGSNNGQICSADYGASCTYCSSDCKNIVVQGDSCGDGTCNTGETCDSCAADCGCSSGQYCDSGSCVDDEEGYDDEDDDSSSSSSGSSSKQTPVSKFTGNSVKKSCNWKCSEWSECADGVQTRTCQDSNNCASEEGKPSLSQACKMPETCFDKIKNQNEKGVDCGGICDKKCSIFSIIGSVIEGPVESSKNFFSNNKTLIIILSSSLFLIAGTCGFIFLWKKNKWGIRDKLELSGKAIAKRFGKITNI